jgi:1-acyl-sn-glycerol-3-phosphate acyltransferase
MRSLKFSDHNNHPRDNNESEEQRNEKNYYWYFGAALLKPWLTVITKRDWRNFELIPKTGAAVIACNHTTYADPLVFAHMLYDAGRAPRFLGKAPIFEIPIVGTIIKGADQIPVYRESDKAREAIEIAVGKLKAGHILGIYPEGTLTRDPDLWPMVAKTGAARIAVIAQVPIIPVAQWGAHNVIGRYSRKIKLFPRTPITFLVGEPIDTSSWWGQQNDHQAMVELTAVVMSRITQLLEEIRGEKAPDTIFDPHKAGLPRTGNINKLVSKEKKDKE